MCFGGPGRREQQLAVGAAGLVGRLEPDLVEALLDRAGRFVGREDALARARPSPRACVSSSLDVHVALELLRIPGRARIPEAARTPYRSWRVNSTKIVLFNSGPMEGAAMLRISRLTDYATVILASLAGGSLASCRPRDVAERTRHRPADRQQAAQGAAARRPRDLGRAARTAATSSPARPPRSAPPRSSTRSRARSRSPSAPASTATAASRRSAASGTAGSASTGRSAARSTTSASRSSPAATRRHCDARPDRAPRGAARTPARG